MNTNNLIRRVSIARKNLMHYLGLSFNWLMKILYFGGIPLSILYGISTKPPMMMYAFYWFTGNQRAIEQMGMGGPPPGMM